MVGAAFMTQIDSCADLADWLRTHPPKHVVAHAALVTWLQVLRDHRDLWWTVANRPETPWDVLRVLALSEDDQIRGRVAMRHKLPEDVRELLKSDPEERVRASTQSRANESSTVEDK
jgi:hypothetical protein